MNAAAVEVMKDLPDLCIAYGVSDEYRWVLSLDVLNPAKNAELCLPSKL